ncbi:pyridoxamine 5'-phosphate oxidase family protein [Ramlibacter sp. WS9]|uniref:pyridoxamine 5'-phosphate oxidase family protein n=1 Tax=Ramlibacter sp. WS9 TaxID=1882741 RepID=UPI0011419EDA|nr:pyridoxamine 5'-phosphate oxidase family protein [Ramlibacter sp. WS9]ROZ79601.1 flavin-nucleotide-binding protein [Ramlibacter sp. WS9]
MSGDTFHEGETALQERTGVRARLADAGPRVIRDHMPDQHREFFAQLPFLVAGTVDAQGQPWASVLAGAPGFVTSPDPKRLDVRAQPLSHEPLSENLAAGAPIGLLGIEPHTRRRNRMNGHVSRFDDSGFSVVVEQSFGNCPKYIQARRPEFTSASSTGPAQRLDALDEAARALIARADTFFIATAHPQAGRGDARAFGVDVSHRGGKPGFVRVDRDGTLTVPDFIGNFFFNTLGNLSVNPRCGLLFIDFDNGDMLQVAARGEIIHDDAEVLAFEGAQRLLRFQVVSVLRWPSALPLRWGEAEMSPVLAATGSWR